MWRRVGGGGVAIVATLNNCYRVARRGSPAAAGGRPASGQTIRPDPSPHQACAAPAADRLRPRAAGTPRAPPGPQRGEAAAPRAEHTTTSRDPKTGGVGVKPREQSVRSAGLQLKNAERPPGSPRRGLQVFRGAEIPFGAFAGLAGPLRGSDAFARVLAWDF